MIYLGCSQWGIESFKECIYPENAKPGDYLYYYSKEFNCVELNPTYHDKVEREKLLIWKSKVNGAFKFCPKFPKTISHDNRLNNVQELTEEFINLVRVFEENLGICFLQLPPNFHHSNLYLIDELLTFIDNRIKVNIEFRTDWLSRPDILRDGLEVLKKHKAGIVIEDDAETIPYLNNIKITNSSAFIRFEVTCLHIDYERINDWINMIKLWQDKGIKEVYFMIHFPDKAESINIINFTRDNFVNKLGWNPDELKSQRCANLKPGTRSVSRED